VPRTNRPEAIVRLTPNGTAPSILPNRSASRQEQCTEIGSESRRQKGPQPVTGNIYLNETEEIGVLVGQGISKELETNKSYKVMPAES